jgi:hypothetical protein
MLKVAVIGFEPLIKQKVNKDVVLVLGVFKKYDPFITL